MIARRGFLRACGVSLLAAPLAVEAPPPAGKVHRIEVFAHRRRFALALTVCALLGLLTGCAGTFERADSPPWVGTYEGVAYASHESTGLTIVLRPSGEQVTGRWTTADGRTGTLIVTVAGPNTLILQGRQDRPSVRETLSGFVTYGESRESDTS
jgi:hypothetical protein